MSFHKSVIDMLNRYGSEVDICTSDVVITTKAFIQPLRYKSQYTKKLSFGGKSSDDYFLYIGKPDCVLDSTVPSIIIFDDKKFVVHNTHSYVFNDKTLYVWAVLKPYYEKRRDEYGPNY